MFRNEKNTYRCNKKLKHLCQIAKLISVYAPMEINYAMPISILKFIHA